MGIGGRGGGYVFVGEQKMGERARGSGCGLRWTRVREWRGRVIEQHGKVCCTAGKWWWWWWRMWMLVGGSGDGKEGGEGSGGEAGGGLGWGVHDGVAHGVEGWHCSSYLGSDSRLMQAAFAGTSGGGECERKKARVGHTRDPAAPSLLHHGATSAAHGFILLSTTRPPSYFLSSRRV